MIKQSTQYQWNFIEFINKKKYFYSKKSEQHETKTRDRHDAIFESNKMANVFISLKLFVKIKISPT